MRKSIDFKWAINREVGECMKLDTSHWDAEYQIHAEIVETYDGLPGLRICFYEPIQERIHAPILSADEFTRILKWAAGGNVMAN